MKNFWFLCPAILAFLINTVSCMAAIPLLRRYQICQPIRMKGPRGHREKTGTATMGGIGILLSVWCTSLFLGKLGLQIMLILVATTGLGIVGIIDDCIKVKTKDSEGLTPRRKFLLQLIVTGVMLFGYFCVGGETRILIPFIGGLQHGFFIENKAIFGLLFLFIVMGTVNGVNLTDGLDGLACGVTLLIVVTLTVIAIAVRSPIAGVCSAMAGALLSFSMFNGYPAKLFMGDCGSLALGGFVAVSAFFLQIPLFIGMIGIVYLAETVSVILQISVFKLCHGKRLFRMAPIHHHFELCGWQETKIVVIFESITMICCIAMLYLL